MSSPHSPLSSTNPRRLSARRRGSMTAPDPFGAFPDTERSMSSTLHIIKAPSLTAAQDVEERARRRTSAHEGLRARSHSGSNGTRISFAFSGFTPVSSQNETMSGTTRPVSPLNARPRVPRSNSFTSSPTTAHAPLTPIQVYELAQQCNRPLSRPPTPGGNVPIPSTPVKFTPLPDAHHLPFLDRPSEVEDLLSTQPTSRLFLLLAQTFPTSKCPEGDADPSSWSYSQLKRWLTKVGRDEVDDVEWVRKARLCISARSEVIWERVKGALGVPVELDIMHDETDRLSTDISLDAEGEDSTEPFGDAWVEPIVAGPSSSAPFSPVRPTTPRRSSSLSCQSVGRMEDISEDIPDDEFPPPAAKVHGLRVVTSPSPPPVRSFSSPSLTSAGSFSHPHLPYDVVADRGPGHPLFPTSFASLALGPTLKANNPSLRSPTAPPASAYPLSHSTSRRREVASWAEGWDPQKQEYALSVASGSSRQSVAVE